MGEERKRVPMGTGEYAFYVVGSDELQNIAEMPHWKDKGTEKREIIDVRIDRLLSDQGATCMVYEGRLSTNGRKVIVKEFYPYSTRNVWAIGRDSGPQQKLRIPALTKEKNREFSSRYQQFVRSFLWQKKFYGESQFLEIVVEPQFFAVYGDTCYIISDYHNGQSMAENSSRFQTLREKIFLCQYLADLLSILEENGYLFLDLCEENILLIRQTKSQYQLRLFDMDSIVDLNDLDNLHWAEGNIFYHEEYAARELAYMEKALQRNQFDDIKKDYLEKSLTVYSLGVLFFKILFGWLPSRDEREQLKVPEEHRLTKHLADTYQLRWQMAGKLMEILRVMMSDQDERYRQEFASCQNVTDALNAFAESMSFEAYMPQRKIADANATFAAYNMLQRHPLFWYSGFGDKGNREIKVALAGSHILRKGFLSALISIGQMLDTTLEISVLAKDAEAFWKEYLSPEHNSALGGAVLWDVNGNSGSEKTDHRLTARPLARLHILTDTSRRRFAELYRQKYRYFVLLDETRQFSHFCEALFRELSSGETEDKICIGYLCDGEETEPYPETGGEICWHPISAACFSEIYNEKMYGEQVYKMGLMAHAYYRGYLNRQDRLDMEALEQEYSNDIYSRLSSERSALHGIYKMASVGVDGSRPGRFRAYFEKISDPEIVEQLGWLEHLSWTAHMLTTRNRPVDIQEFGSYAYQKGNNWKDLSNPEKIRHPLLAASEPVKKLPDRDWDRLSQEDIAQLDALDFVSYQIYRWYCKQRLPRGRMLERIFEKNRSLFCNGAQRLFERLQDSAQKCAGRMGDFWEEECQLEAENFQTTLETAVRFLEEMPGEQEKNRENMSGFFTELREVMEPVIDSYKNRDYKQIDRDLTYSVLDLTVV